MRKFAIIIMTLFAVTLLGCSQKTEALAHKSLMAQPLLHQQTTASKQDNDPTGKSADSTGNHP